MKPTTILAFVILVLVGGLLVMSGLFSGDDVSTPPAATPTTATDGPKTTATATEAPKIDPDKPAEPAPREVVRESATPGVEASAGDSMLGGRVVNTADEGIPDAQVALYYGSANAAFNLVAARKPTGIATQTDADGNYSFENIAAANNYVAVASHPDYAQGERIGISVEDSGSQVVPNIILTQGQTLHGVVKGAVTQAPIAGATVELWDTLASNFFDPAMRKPWKSTATDAEGEYEFKNVHFNAFEVVVAAEGFATVGRREAQIFLAAPVEGAREFNFDLPAALTIAGVVTDARGTPVEGARIDADQIGQLADRGGSKGNATSAAGGAFKINGLAEGTYTIVAQRPGFSQKLAGQFPGGASDVRIQLEPRGTISGTVKDPSGRPVSRFELRLMAARDEQVVATNQSRRYESGDGAFTFDDAEPGQYALEAISDGYGPTRSAKFFVDRETPTANIAIVMKVGASLAGRVTGANGEPVANAEVSVQENKFTANFLSDIFGSLPNSPPQRVTKTRTKKDGSFEFKSLAAPPAPNNLIQVAVKAKNHSPFAKDDVVLTEGQATDVGVLVLSSGGQIVGSCVDASDKPYCDGTITASLVRDPNAPATGMPEQRTIKPDFDGRFTLANLAPGDWDLTMTPDKVDGKEMNPLLKVLMSQQTKQVVPVRDGQITDVKLRLPPQQK